VFQGGSKRPGTLNNLLALSQRPRETLHTFMHRFCQFSHDVVKTSDNKIMVAFITGVHDNQCHEDLGIREPSTVSELYVLMDECTEQRKGLAPDHAAQSANDPVPSAKKKGTRKRTSK
jgi:hypothetical protein